jgi:hypothetical protein
MVCWGVLFHFSIVWCPGQVFDLSGLNLVVHFVLGCVSYHQRCVGVGLHGFDQGSSRVAFARSMLNNGLV